MYKVVAIGGTFDRLHKGHKHFISHAFGMGKKVLIGLTSDKYVKEKFKIQNSRLRHPLRKSFEGQEGFGGQAKLKIKVNRYEDRKSGVEYFLKENKFWDRTEIIKIDDVYGNAGNSKDIEAIVVTKDSFAGARSINRKRSLNGLKPLDIVKANLEKADDDKIISSSRIRDGQINRWGKSYANLPIWGKKISEELRQVLKEPIGQLIEGDDSDIFKIAPIIKNLITETQPTMIITVGDQVIRLCNTIGERVDIAIFDYKVNREKIYHSLSDIGFDGLICKIDYTVKNSPGNISRTLVTAIKRALKENQINIKSILIKVIGEDDLAGVPAILLAPLDTVVIYGQPKKGLVFVKVTEEKKEELRRLVTKYS